ARGVGSNLRQRSELFRNGLGQVVHHRGLKMGDHVDVRVEASERPCPQRLLDSLKDPSLPACTIHSLTPEPSFSKARRTDAPPSADVQTWCTRSQVAPHVNASG